MRKFLFAIMVAALFLTPVCMGQTATPTPTITPFPNEPAHEFSALAVKDLWVARHVNYCTDGALDADYILTSDSTEFAFPALYKGLRIGFFANTANSGACTIDLDGLGEKALLALNDQEPADNYIEAGSYVEAVYNGTAWVILTPDANP